MCKSFHLVTGCRPCQLVDALVRSLPSRKANRFSTPFRPLENYVSGLRAIWKVKNRSIHLPIIGIHSVDSAYEHGLKYPSVRALSWNFR